MPIHDWTKVTAGIFHDFHYTWITEIKKALYSGVLPAGYYALAEQIAGGLGPDVLALEAPAGKGPDPAESPARNGGVAVATRPPQARFHVRTQVDEYAAKANVIAIRHSSNHEVVAMLEIVSSGDKNSRHGLRSFVSKADEAVRAGIHLLIIDLFPPGSFNPQGIHGAIWEELADEAFTLPSDRPLTVASYVGGASPEAYVEPVAVGLPLPEMPLFLTRGYTCRCRWSRRMGWRGMGCRRFGGRNWLRAGDWGR